MTIAWIPIAGAAFGLFLFALMLRVAIANGVAKRRVLLVGLILSALPAIYIGLVWTRAISDSHLRLARPWVTVVGAVAAWFIAIRLARFGARQGSFRRRIGEAITMGAAFAASLAATGPELGRPLDRLTIIAALDRSRSIDLVPGADQRVVRELQIAERGMHDEDRIGTIAFGTEAATEDPPRPHSQLGAAQHAAIGRDGTDIGAAIRRGLADVPPDSAARIVLVTDGVATRGDALAAAAAAVAAGIPIDVLPLEQRAVPDVRVVSLRAPARADEGEAFDLRLVTSAPAKADIEVRIHRDGELIARAAAKIAAGEDVLRIKQTAPGPGLHRYDVEITALDPKLDEAPEDNSGSTFVRVRGTALALVIDGDKKSAFVAKSLESAAFKVDEAGATGVPGDLGGLAGYDLVVLSDVRASDLSPTQIEALASYVKDLGGGLILLGGDRSMGPGGYSRSPIEEISPVSFDLKQERRRASLAEVIGIDYSGSMGAHLADGRTKLDLANEAAARSAGLLGAGDLLGVEHVDTAVRWSVPLGPVVDKDKIDRAIREVGVGGGGIYVDITLDAGYAALAAEKVNLKHMLLFADGGDAEQMHGCDVKVADALARGITTSVVALGNGSDVPELERLSRLGNGRFYLIEDAARLPAVFAQETILAARSAIVEKPFKVRRSAASQITAGIDVDAAPALEGYVVTIPKPRSSVLLTGLDGDPVLAVWSAGIGRTAAFTSDLKDRWGEAWTTWPGAARLVAQVARDVSRKGEDAHVRLESDAAGGVLHVRATVVGDDGRAQSFKRLALHVAGPEGFSRELPLEAIGAGAYAADVPLSRPGTYVAVARDELAGQAVGTTGAVLTAGEELRPTGSDLALLGRIADFTGGKRRDTLAGIFGDRAARRFSYEDITSALVLIAALGLITMVGARRLAWPERLVAWMKSVRQTGAVAATPGAPAAAALLDAKRAREAQGSDEALDLAKNADETRPSPRPPAAVPRPAAQPLRLAARVPRPPGGAADAASGPPSSRPLTAAEILLARRRGKRP